MKQHVRLNLNNFSTASSLPERLAFIQCANIKNCGLTFTQFIIEPSMQGAIRVDNTWYSATSIKQISLDETYIEFDCYIDLEFNDIVSLMGQNILEFDVSGYTSIFLFKQQSENDVLNKDINLWDILSGKFNHAINLKNVNVDVHGYDCVTNYAWIPSLNRYYYIDSVELISADFSRLHLREDVLMTWKNLIKQQSAFVTRYAVAERLTLIDERRPLSDKLTIEDITSTLTDTPANTSLVNVTLDFNNYAGKDNPNILIVSMSTQVAQYRSSYLHAPANSGLPDISTQLNDYEWVNFIQPSKLNYFSKAYFSDDTKASYIESAIWLPFNPVSVFGLHTDANLGIFVSDSYIDNNGNFVPISSTNQPLTTFQSTLNSGIDGVCPYLIIKDFTFPNITSMIDREPNANYEIYIPFVGWIKVDSNKLSLKRCLIYYTMDLKSGISTAYLYNFTDKYVVWSATCQLGIKIDLTTTNQLENIRQKQANDLNMILGLLSSAVSVGVGVVSENPVAIAGGVLAGGKTIAGYVNANNQIFERAQMSFGTANGGLYSNLSVICMKSYHAPLPIDANTYNHLQGYPYNNYVSTMTTLSGYVEIGEIHFNPNGESIYQDEIQEIVSLLQNGVIF